MAYSSTGINNKIAGMVMEGCRIRSIAGLLRLATNTILRRIKQIANDVNRPLVVMKQEFVEVDELRTFVGSKRNDYWVAYAFNRQMGKVIDFITGKRVKRNLKVLIDTLLSAQVKKVYTVMYQFVGSNGEYVKWFKGKDGLLNEATRQIRAANGTTIEWHFQSQKSLNATRSYLQRNGITQGIDFKLKTP